MVAFTSPCWVRILAAALAISWSAPGRNTRALSWTLVDGQLVHGGLDLRGLGQHRGHVGGRAGGHVAGGRGERRGVFRFGHELQERRCSELLLLGDAAGDAQAGAAGGAHPAVYLRAARQEADADVELGGLQDAQQGTGGGDAWRRSGRRRSRRRLPWRRPRPSCPCRWSPGPHCSACHGFGRIALDVPLLGPAAAPAPQVVLQRPARVAGQGRVACRRTARRRLAFSLGAHSANSCQVGGARSGRPAASKWSLL